MTAEKPAVGDPASIVLWTDTVAAVVVKVNPKSIVVRRVEVGPMERDNRVASANLPVMSAEGILDKPIGEPERYPLIGFYEGGAPRYASGSVVLRVGYSRSRRDYRV